MVNAVMSKNEYSASVRFRDARVRAGRTSVRLGSITGTKVNPDAFGMFKKAFGAVSSVAYVNRLRRSWR